MSLLPILKNREELEKQKSRGLFVEKLFPNERSPIIMYGKDKDAFMEYTQSKSEEEDMKTKEQAIRNLENIDVPLQLQDIKGFKIAMVQHEYAAEKILDKAFMKEIAAELDSNSIVVGIPMKGFMTAVAKGKGEANLYGGVVKQYKDTPTYPISDSLYYVVDGEIEMMGVNGPSTTKKDENGVYEIVGRNDERGKIGFIARVGHKNEDGLTDQIQSAFQNILLQGMKDAKKFNGKIDFHISTEFNQLTPSLEEQVKKIAKNISERGAVQIMGGLSGEEFKVRFFYGDNKLIAETIETEPIQMTNKRKDSKTKPEAHRNKPDAPRKSDKRPWWKFW